MSHPTDSLYRVNPSQPQELIEDYLIVPQNSAERPTWYASNDLYTGLASTVETNLGFNAFDFFLPVGGGPQLHYHLYENEVWYGIEGDLVFSFGNQPGAVAVEPEFTLNVPASTLVFGPRLRPHTYNNIDSTEATVGDNQGARTLSFTTPGGLDLFFDYVGTSVDDRDDPIPAPEPPSPAILNQLSEIGSRISGTPYFILPEPDYVPAAEVLDYVLVLPENPDDELVEAVLPLVDVPGFSIWQIDGDENIPLPTRPTFQGPFEIEYTSLLTLEETGNEMAYSQFEIAPQATTTSAYAILSSPQVVGDTESLATGNASLQTNEAGEIEYSLTISGLDFGELKGDNPQTPDRQDDVTKIQLHSGDRGSNGDYEFNIFDPERDESDFDLVFNDDGTVTIDGVWSDSEAKITPDLIDLLDGDGLPGADSNFYWQIHTVGNESGEIRGQIGLTTDRFPEPVVSENQEAFYVKDGYLSLMLDDEVRLIEPNTFVYIAPGQAYSFANFGDEPVESLAVTIPVQPEPERIIRSPLESPVDTAWQSVFLGDEADLFHPPDQSDRQVYGRNGNDELLANSGDFLFGEAGDDILNGSANGSQNLLDGGTGNDELLGGKDSELVGGVGDDILRIERGGNNLLYGNAGADRFWLADGTIPDTVIEEKQLTDLGLPVLLDTKNTIVDFEPGVDRIGIAGIAGVSSFANLKLLPAFGDLRSTSIVVQVDGIEAEVSLGNVVDVYSNQLSAEDFVFA